MARLNRIEVPPVSCAAITTLLLLSSGRRLGSSMGGKVVVKFRYEAAGASVPGDAVGAFDGAAGGYWTAVRNVPFTAWPANVTWATLSVLACARNAEYGAS